MSRCPPFGGKVTLQPAALLDPRFSSHPRAPNPAKAPHRPAHENAQNKPTCASKAGEVSRMKESHDQGLAHQIDPESCAPVREGGGEALTGADAGRPYTVPKAFLVPDADAHVGARKATPPGSPSRENRPGPAGPQKCVHASKHLAGSWEIPCSTRPSGRVRIVNPLTEHDDDERAWEVGQTRSTGEVFEQRRGCARGRGGDGGKGPGQGEGRPTKQAADTVLR
jgi:hypothetical protein